MPRKSETIFFYIRGMELNIYQIYFNEKQLAKLDFIPYDNTGKLKPTFENAVIDTLAESGKLFKGDLCGVLSHAWRQKSAAAMQCTPEKIEKAYVEGAQVIGFHPFYEDKGLKHDPFKMLDNWHRGTTPKASYILQRILEEIGKPSELKRPSPRNIIYSNAWIATPDVYRRYWQDYLGPALAACEIEPIKGWLWQDSGYTKNKLARIKPILRAQIGAPYYPLHTFILERLPIVFLEQNPEINVTHIR